MTTVKKNQKQLSKKGILTGQEGSAIVLAILVLAVVTILGVTSVNLTNTELSIVRNEQIYQKNFYHAESGNTNEGYRVGHSSKPWYLISNPSIFNQLLYPDASNYDPGNDISIPGNFPSDIDEKDPRTWPHENLLDDTTDDENDYAYLVMYLHFGNPPKGYDASFFTGYKFRINSRHEVDIETGGTKVGVKMSSF